MNDCECWDCKHGEDKDIQPMNDGRCPICFSEEHSRRSTSSKKGFPYKRKGLREKK